ncbi:MAG: ATP-binding cassette domain-containing protein [Candidatus Delongbacteria bacterium]|nr:ATP-binding cassette domain-containing protein [Candidatus Delongbacteria bacterium]
MIRIENLHKTFNSGTMNEVYALRGIDLEIREGDFVTIIGTNGSGKSTLLNAIAGSFLPDQGRILLDGHEVTRRMDYERAKYISRVFQNPFSGTAPHMTIAENLHAAYLRGAKRFPVIGLTAARKKHYRQELAALEMQMEDRIENVIGSLSGGQRQAITLLMAVIRKPKVLLLDEHTAALDPKSAAQVIRLTQRFIERDGLTAVMVTHSMQQALELGNKTIMMNKGKVIDEISLQEKKRLTVNDLLEKFADLRKSERLTDELVEELKREYA